jgi:cell division septation protein DedD
VTNDTISQFYKIEAVEKKLNGYSVKIASFYIEEKALETVRQLKEETGDEVFIQTVPKNDKVLYRIFAGRFKLKSHAEGLHEKLKDCFPDCYVVELNAK